MFGEIVAAEMRANAAGRMIEETWREMPQFLPTVALDAFQLMPNHLHGVLLIDACAAPGGIALEDVVQRFKALTTRRYIEGVKACSWPRFTGRLWQRGYDDRILRNDASLERVRNYIAANPARWEFDRENPHARSPVEP